MASVCIGCGLTTDADGNLIADVNDSTWPASGFGTEASCAAPVYCSDNGGLHVGPRPKIRAINKGPFNIVILGAPVTLTDEQDDYGTITFSYANPSPCLPAIMYANVILDMDLRIQPGTRVRMYVNGDQVFDFTNRGSATLIDMGWDIPIPVQAFTLAAGAPSANWNGVITISATGGSGATLSKLQYFVSGIIIAADIA